MDLLTTVILGALVSLVTEVGKKYLPGVTPLLWVAVLSILGGLGYAFIVPLVPTEVLEKMILGFTTAIGMYEVLTALTKASK